MASCNCPTHICNAKCAFALKRTFWAKRRGDPGARRRSRLRPRSNLVRLAPDHRDTLRTWATALERRAEAARRWSDEGGSAARRRCRPAAIRTLCVTADVTGKYMWYTGFCRRWYKSNTFKVNSQSVAVLQILPLSLQKKQKTGVPCMARFSEARSSAAADKPARRVYRSVKVTKHSTIPYVRYCFQFILVTMSLRQSTGKYW